MLEHATNGALGVGQRLSYFFVKGPFLCPDMWELAIEPALVSTLCERIQAFLLTYRSLSPYNSCIDNGLKGLNEKKRAKGCIEKEMRMFFG